MLSLLALEGIIDQQSEVIFSAAAVRIVFREQKKKDKWNAMTQKATDNLLMNPFRIMI